MFFYITLFQIRMKCDCTLLMFFQRCFRFTLRDGWSPVSSLFPRFLVFSFLSAFSSSLNVYQYPAKTSTEVSHRSLSSKCQCQCCHQIFIYTSDGNMCSLQCRWLEHSQDHHGRTKSASETHSWKHPSLMRLLASAVSIWMALVRAPQIPFDMYFVVLHCTALACSKESVGCVN